MGVRLFSSFSYVEELPGGIEYELLPGDSFTYETKLVCKYRGEYEVGVKTIVITDFLRLFQISYKVPKTLKAIVLPKIERLSELRCIADISVLLQRENFREQTEPDVVVRDYVPGDALKQIHWKAVAREQKLKVRTRTGEEKAADKEMFRTAAAERKELMKILKEKKKWRYFVLLVQCKGEVSLLFRRCRLQAFVISKNG